MALDRCTSGCHHVQCTVHDFLNAAKALATDAEYAELVRLVRPIAWARNTQYWICSNCGRPVLRVVESVIDLH